MAHEKQRYFLDKIDDYASTSKNKELVNSIADIRKALLVDSFWVDAKELTPADEKVWCEVWLSSDKLEVVC